MRKFATGLAIVLASASLAACGEKTTTTNTTEITTNEEVVLNDEAPVLVNEGNLTDGNVVE